jgi:hypothetical protein
VLGRLDTGVQLVQSDGFLPHLLEPDLQLLQVCASTEQLAFDLRNLSLCGGGVDFRLLLLGVRPLELS